MNQNWILHARIFCLFASSVYSDLTKDPLIFNPYTLEIHDLDSISSSTHDGVFALACPAQTAEQVKFNQDTSLDRKALFVSHFFKKKNPELRAIKCEKPYEMAVIHHTVKNRGRLLEFGYEIYYKSYDTYIYHSIINYRVDFSFGRAEEVDSKLKQFFHLLHKDTLPLKQKAFVWIPKVQFRYIRSEWNMRWVSYSINLKTDQLQVGCKTFDFGLRLYDLNEGQKLGDFYSIKNQEKIFSQLQLPASVDDVCKSQYKCVEEYHLVAPHQFQTSISEPIQCSHLTSIPIWYKRTRELLDHAEKLAISFSQTVGNEVEVVTGILDVLAFPQKNQKNPKPTPIHLDSEKGRLPVPKIIYKIVSSKTDDCDEKKLICQYDMVFIIHNEPETNPQQKLCKDTCEQWGWESIQYLGITLRTQWNKSEFVYCCELDKQLQRKLAYSKKMMKNGNLRLYCVENYKPRGDSRKPSVCPNIHTEVENIMNELFGPKPKSDSGLST